MLELKAMSFQVEHAEALNVSLEPFSAEAHRTDLKGTVLCVHLPRRIGRTEDSRTPCL